MKKSISLFSIIAVAGLCLMFSSCTRDEDTEIAMTVSGQWQGDWGMYYEYTYPNGDVYTYNSYDTDLVFYPDYDYAEHGYGYQVDWYRTGPYERLSYRFSWNVVNGVLFLNYPGFPEYNTSIRDYRLNNSHFVGYFNGSSTRFDLIKIQDYYTWYDYDYLYRSHGYAYIEWTWDGGYYYDGIYYSYAKTRNGDANTDSVSKPAGRITKIGSRFAE